MPIPIPSKQEDAYAALKVALATELPSATVRRWVGDMNLGRQTFRSEWPKATSDYLLIIRATGLDATRDEIGDESMSRNGHGEIIGECYDEADSTRPTKWQALADGVQNGIARAYRDNPWDSSRFRYIFGNFVSLESGEVEPPYAGIRAPFVVETYEG